MICFNEHFVALRRDPDGLFVNQGHKTHEWEPVCLNSDREAALRWSKKHRRYDLNVNKLDGVFRVQALSS